MDRALNLETLNSALGYHPRLPNPDDLQRLLTDTELRLFTRQGGIDDQLLDAGWYLQAVASARSDLELYDLPRQRRAHQVSGHIFDLVLQSADLSEMERLRYTFAAQVGYLGGELTPNASALVPKDLLPSEPYEWSEAGRMSLEAGILLLGLKRQDLYSLLSVRQEQLAEVGLGPYGITVTPYDAVAKVINGVRHLLNYLTYGRIDDLDQARGLFSAAVASEAAASDVDSRWVSAHMRRLCDNLASTSIWAVIPPDLRGAALAMTLGSPPVLALWPPQLSFLGAEDAGPAPLDPATRRLVLSFPTNAGKTLLAQILIAAQVVSTEGNVCVVAPTHSLCREISDSLYQRLRTLGCEIHQEGPLGLDISQPPEVRVSVMTPEKLAAMLRSDAAGLLARFSMFVIDEAHLVADPSRGWRLEETLSFLHHNTLNTDHRILLLSAALGNQAHIVKWIQTEPGEVVHRYQDWRGPRRLHALYMTEFSNRGEKLVPADGPKRARRHSPLRGVIYLRAGTATKRGEFPNDVGVLVRRHTRSGQWKKDSTESTKQRDHLVPLINHVAGSGPVLVVEATRLEAQRVAEVVADSRPESSTDLALVDLTRTRLGEGHPLTSIVSKGVAFHHAALPVDIQAEIESAVRSGRIQVLVATSTLTEGINLPFKTVIIGNRGYPTAEGQKQLISDADLLNAIGRAGRAGRETEGWAILTAHEKYNSSLFDQLEPTGDDLYIESRLATEDALEKMAAFEMASRTAEDAIFARYDQATAGFLSFIWFVAQSVEGIRTGSPLDAVISVVQNTLAWHQLETAQRETLLAAAKAALDSFQAQDPAQRTRWARSGASIPTARTLESVARDIQTRITPDLDLGNLVATLDFMLTDENLATILELDENDRRGFKPRRNAPRSLNIDVDVKTLLLDWVGGEELQHLADRYLSEVSEDGYQYEQLAEFSTSVFEHHLPWTLSIIIGWVNQHLEVVDSAYRLPDHLPGAVYYGVDTEVALQLMTSGVRSRRLANAVATQESTRPDSEKPVREWLAEQSIAEWRSGFDASPTELADLLSYVRAPNNQSIRQLLDGNTLQFAIVGDIDLVAVPTEARLAPNPDAPAPSPIVVHTESGPVGEIKPSDHDDIAQLISMGVPLRISVSPGPASLIVTISRAPESPLET